MKKVKDEKYTPGPWKASGGIVAMQERNLGLVWSVPERLDVAYILPEDGPMNGRLIAEAPAMYETLKRHPELPGVREILTRVEG